MFITVKLTGEDVEMIKRIANVEEVKDIDGVLCDFFCDAFEVSEKEGTFDIMEDGSARIRIPNLIEEVQDYTSSIPFVGDKE